MATVVGVFKNEQEARRAMEQLGPGGTEATIQSERSTDGRVRLLVATPDAAKNHIGNVLRASGADEVFVHGVGDLGSNVSDRQDSTKS